MRKTKHQKRVNMDRIVKAALKTRKTRGKLQTGGALYADHYTGKVHYV